MCYCSHYQVDGWGWEREENWRKYTIKGGCVPQPRLSFHRRGQRLRRTGVICVARGQWQQQGWTQGLLTRQAPCRPAFCHQPGEAPRRRSRPRDGRPRSPGDRCQARAAAGAKGPGPNPSPSLLHLLSAPSALFGLQEKLINTPLLAFASRQAGQEEEEEGRPRGRGELGSDWLSCPPLEVPRQLSLIFPQWLSQHSGDHTCHAPRQGAKPDPSPRPRSDPGLRSTLPFWERKAGKVGLGPGAWGPGQSRVPYP